MRYLGKRYGYYPDDPDQAWLVDSTMDALNDVINTVARIYWEKDEDRKKAMVGDFLGGTYPKFLKALSTRLEENYAAGGTFFVGSKLTVADFLFGNFVHSLIYNELAVESAAVLKAPFEQHPALVKYAESVKSELGWYLEARPKRAR
jgi:glutathione S-transferase